MLAAQMEKGADKAMAAVAVVITTACPVAVVGKMLEHQVEQLHGLRDVGLRHWSWAPDAVNGPTLSRRRRSTPSAPGRVIGYTEPASLLLTSPTRGLTGPATIS